MLRTMIAVFPRSGPCLARRGTSLASTLMLVAVLVVLAFALVSVGVSNLNFTTRLDTLEHGRALSESVIALACDSLRLDPTFGTVANRGGVLDMKPRTGLGSARLTFDPILAVQLGIPCSTNNLEGSAAVPGWGRPVPAGTVHLIGCSTVGGVTRNVEILLEQPAFPYAIASGGTLESSGNLLVGALPEGSDPTVTDLEPDGLQPANLLSNDALVLGPNSMITGDVRAVGDVTIDPLGSRVGGQVKVHSSPVTLPQLDLSSYDPQGRSDLQQLSQSQLSSPVLVGWARRQGDLDIQDGLVLDQGVLFVEGDLTLSGGVHGVGAVFVTGKATVRGGSRLASDNQVALVSGGDMRLQAAGPRDSSYFQGMVYAGGDFRANQVTMLGALVARGSVKLTGVDLVQQPESTRMELQPGALSQLSLSEGQSVYRIPVRFDSPTYSVQNPVTLELQSGLTRDQAVDRVLLVLGQIAPQASIPRLDVEAALDAVASAPPASAQDSLQLDLSKFLPFEQRMHILMWKQKPE